MTQDEVQYNTRTDFIAENDHLVLVQWNGKALGGINIHHISLFYYIGS